jgi:hypothetical protein
MKKQRKAIRKKPLSKRSRGNRKVRNYEKSKLGNGRWHFWFLITITILAFGVGYQGKDLYAGLVLGFCVYVLPVLISLRYRFDLTKGEIKRFYLP